MMKVALVLLFAAYAYGCGTPTYEPSVSRVVQGEDARPHSWPWVISLQYRSGSTYRHTCGGTLLAPNWVITAGHCIGRYTYRVVLGEYDIRKEEGEQVRAVERIIVHPGWNSNCPSCGNNIAMIKLASPAVLNDKVQPSCVPESGEIVPHNYPCYVTGWGRLYSNGPISSKLQQALLPVVSNSICNSDWWAGTIKTTMICAGGGIHCFCHGVTSFCSSFECSTLKRPTVFTRTSSFTQWISDTMLQY
ncbi:proproteinase E-like protein [Lates japonicus]|uniref:Proproteinase E-like protein n=1 Tax=Lates japonicus TaxID=270547 RepID=A0AAD3QWR0_LATJO|nr:proproteinase E-like protein [Lates japonicus]